MPSPRKLAVSLAALTITGAALAFLHDAWNEANDITPAEDPRVRRCFAAGLEAPGTLDLDELDSTLPPIMTRCVCKYHPDETAACTRSAQPAAR